MSPRSRDVMKALADARPARLDPDPHNDRRDPYAIMAHPQPTTPAARTVRQPTRRLVLAGLVPTMALVAAGAVFLTGGVGGGGTGPTGTLGASIPATDRPTATAAPAPRTARELLLVAAERSAADPTTGGRYWVLDQEDGELREVGPKNRRYKIMDRHGLRLWDAMSPSDRSVLFSRDLGAVPFTAEDRAAWQADGSPTQWIVPAPKDLPDAEPIVISGTPGPETSGPGRPAPRGKGGGKVDYFLAGGPISLTELAGLPTEPAALKAWLRKRLKASEIQEATNYSLFWTARTLVFDLPVSPQVRAAAYRMLADVPGVTSLGEVMDQRGRAGVAVGFARKGDGGHWSQARLIIDPQTGQALASESWDLGSGQAPKANGTLLSYTLVVSTGFTNDSPPAGTTPQK